MRKAERAWNERRVRDSHSRWWIMGALRTPGGCQGIDGHPLLTKLDFIDLYCGAFASGESFFVHPSWLRPRRAR